MSPLQFPVLVLLKYFGPNPFLAIISVAEFFSLQAWSIAEQHKAQTVHSFLEGKMNRKIIPNLLPRDAKKGPSMCCIKFQR